MIIYLAVALQAAQDDKPPVSGLTEHCTAEQLERPAFQIIQQPRPWRWSGCSDQEVCTYLEMTWPSPDSYLHISLSLWTPGHSIRQITIDFEGPIEKLTNKPTNHLDNKLGKQQTNILTVK